MLSIIRQRTIGSTTDLFSHGPKPLENTLAHPGDPGLLGPESVSWRVIGDVTAFVGGIRALLVQTALPEVVAGVDQHSRYREDPLGRLSRTAYYVTSTTFGAMPEVHQAVAMVRGAHRGVAGTSERSQAYRADDPALAAWVHNALTESFLVAYRSFGPEPLSERDADLFVLEQSRIGALLGADPLPTTAHELSDWIDRHPGVEHSEAQRRALGFLRRPPLPIAVRLPYAALFNAAAATVSPNVRETLRVHVPQASEQIGQVVVSGLRWALGSSPSWHVSLVRCGAPVPQGLFKQPLPGTGRPGIVGMDEAGDSRAETEAGAPKPAAADPGG
jgi:uncharacterized protein (DUF2236 family)